MACQHLHPQPSYCRCIAYVLCVSIKATGIALSHASTCDCVNPPGSTSMCLAAAGGAVLVRHRRGGPDLQGQDQRDCRGCLKALCLRTLAAAGQGGCGQRWQQQSDLLRRQRLRFAARGQPTAAQKHRWMSKSCLALSLSCSAVNTLCTQSSPGNAILQPLLKQISFHTHQHAPSLQCFVHGVIPDPSYLHC